MRKRGITATLVAASTLVVGVLVAPSASAKAAPKAVPNTKPAWLGSAQHLGHASASSAVSARIYLSPSGGGLAAMAAQATAMATKGNAQYRKFLTAAQYQTTYGVSKATVKSVEKWATAAGLKVTGVGDLNSYISVSSTAGTAQKAFGVTLDTYKHSGQTVQAPTGAVTLPASVASSVLTVTGLDTTASMATPSSSASVPPPAGFNNARPCSTYYGQYAPNGKADTNGVALPKYDGAYLPYAICGYTGPQFRAAYEGADSSVLDGSGATVAIVDAYASPYIASDAETYADNHGDGSYAPGQLTQVVASPFTHTGTGPNGCGENGWWGEETLDVEAVHAMAPGANIRFYGAASCYDSDLTDALQKVVNQDKAQIVTNSYGEVEGGESAGSVTAYEKVFLQGALEGISFTFSSADDGDEVAATALKQANYPASDPYVTGVGGTSTAINANGQLAWQTGWGTDKYTLSSDGKSWNPLGFLYGAGGGSSSLFNMPSYQVGVASGATRQVPDVAMDADPTTGMLVGQTQGFPNAKGKVVPQYGEYRIGGTSLASPLFAGFTALAIGGDGGTGFGLLNPTIYANASTGVFTDVKATPNKDLGNVRVDYANGLNASIGLLYSVRTFGNDSSLPLKKGYDTVTGVGSPNSNWPLLLLGATG